LSLAVECLHNATKAKTKAATKRVQHKYFQPKRVKQKKKINKEYMYKENRIDARHAHTKGKKREKVSVPN